MIVLPLRASEAVHTFTSVLLGKPYNFRVRWSIREELWYMDVYEEDGTPINVDIAIVLGAYLGRSSTHELFMGGIFAARDLSKQLKEAGFDDLGTRVQVWFFTRDEAAGEIMGDISERSQ